MLRLIFVYILCIDYLGCVIINLFCSYVNVLFVIFIKIVMYMWDPACSE